MYHTTQLLNNANRQIKQNETKFHSEKCNVFTHVKTLWIWESYENLCKRKLQIIKIYEKGNYCKFVSNAKYAKYELCKKKLAKLENALIEWMLTATDCCWLMLTAAGRCTISQYHPITISHYHVYAYLCIILHNIA